MATQTHTAKIWGLEMTIEADWTDAAYPVTCDDELTHYQVANFCHRPEEAMRTFLLRDAAIGEGCPVDDLSDEITEEIDEAVRVMT